MALKIAPRELHTIAAEIRLDWKKIAVPAEPYLDAMDELKAMTDMYGCDEAAGIVCYFLGNANSWKGETARRIKAELNTMLKAVR